MNPIRATEYIELFVDGEYATARRHHSQTPCPHCKDMGFLSITDPRGYSTSRRCRCWGFDQRIKAYNRAKIPARYLDAHLEGFHPREHSGREALQRAREFAWSFTPHAKGLLIYGGYGTGKTYLTISLVRILTLLRGYSVRFIEFSHLLSQLQSQFKRSHTQNPSDELIQPLIQADCLVIDELGEGRQSEWTKSVLEELITKRYNASGTTLITTNYDPRLSQRGATHHLEDRVGPRIYSRLQQMCSPVSLFGVDYRKLMEERVAVDRLFDQGQ
jgi:DNA replication protein DnaC